MVTSLWLSRLLLLISVAGPCISIQFFPDSDFDGRGVSTIEADAFFRKLDDLIQKRNLLLEAGHVSVDNNATKRGYTKPKRTYTDLYRRALLLTSQSIDSCFKTQADAGPGDISTGKARKNDKDANCDYSVDQFLSYFGYDNFADLSGKLNGNDYVVNSFVPSMPTGGRTRQRPQDKGGISELKAVYRKKGASYFDLPGVRIYHGRPARPVDLTLRLKESGTTGTPANGRHPRKAQPASAKRRRSHRKNKHGKGVRRASQGTGRTTRQGAGSGRGSGGGRGAGSGSGAAPGGGEDSQSSGKKKVDVEITLEGAGNIKLGKRVIGTPTIAINVKISQAFNEDTFGIVYDITEAAEAVFNDIKQRLMLNYLPTFLLKEPFKKYTPTEVVKVVESINNVLTFVKAEISSYKMKGAFDKEDKFQFEVTREGRSIGGYNITQLGVIVSFKNQEAEIETPDSSSSGQSSGNSGGSSSGSNGGSNGDDSSKAKKKRKFGFTLFAVFPSDTNLFAIMKGNTTGNETEDNPFMQALDAISSDTWCLLVASKSETFMNGIKTDVMTNCLADALEKPTPSTATPAPATTTTPPPSRNGGRPGSSRPSSQQSRPSAAPDTPETAPPTAEEKPEIGAGVHFYVKLNLEGVLNKCLEKFQVSVSNSAITLPIYASLTVFGMTIKVPKAGVSNLNTLIGGCVAALIGSAKDMFAQSSLSVEELEYTYDATKKASVFKVGVSYSPNGGGGYTLPGTDIILQKITMSLDNKQVSGNQGSVLGISGATTISLFESTATVGASLRGEHFTININVKMLTLATIFKGTIGYAGFTAPEILSTVGIKNLDFAYEYISPTAFNMEISGTPLILSYDQLQLSVVAYKKQGSTATEFSVAVYFNAAGLDDLLKRIIGNEVMSMKWLKDLHAIVIFSTVAGKLAENTPTPHKRSEFASTREESKLHSPNEKITYGIEQALGRTRRHNPRQQGRPAQQSKTRAARPKQPPGIKFTGLPELFKGLEYVRGLTFGVLWIIPSDKKACGDNGICTFLVKYTGGTGIMIVGAVGPTWFKLAASINPKDAKLIDEQDRKLKFKQLALIMEVGTQVPRFMIQVTMEYMDKAIGATENNVLTFRGAIEATPISFKVSVSMEGYIFPSTVSTYFGIGNVLLGAGVSFITVTPTFEFGASLLLGKDLKHPTNGETYLTANSHAIEVKIYFGVDAGDASKNWMYGSVNKLSISGVCDAFKIERCDDVPEQLRTSGFPSGVEISYSTTGATVPGVGQIDTGLKIVGTLKFLDLECYCYLKLASNEWKIHIKMSPISWAGGAIQLLYAEDVTDRGPEFLAAIGGPVAFKLELNAHLNALWLLHGSTAINITTESIYFKITGYVIPMILKAAVKFELNSGGSSENLILFEAEVITTDFKDLVIEKIKEFIGYLHDKAVDLLKAADDALTEAQKDVAAANVEVEEWKGSIDEWKESLRKEKKILQDNAPNPPPCSEQCALVCLPFLDWNSECWQIWGYWVGCPFWNDCYTKIRDPFCLANCAVTGIIDTITRWIKQAVLEIEMLLAEGAKGLGRLAQGVLDLGSGVLKMAGEASDWAKDGLGVLKEATNEWVDGAFSLLEVHQLQLKARVTADFSPCVSYILDITLDGTRHPFSGGVCLDVMAFFRQFVLLLINTSQSTRTITTEAEKLTEAERKNAGTRNSIRQLKEEQGNAKEKIEEEEKKTFARPSLKSKSSKRSDIPSLHKVKSLLAKLPKRTTVPTAEEAELLKLANKPIPRFTATSDPELRSLIKEGPWPIADRKHPVGYDAKAHRDPTVKEKRFLNFEENISPCERIKRALNGYDGLTNGLIMSSQSIQECDVSADASFNERDNKLRQLRSDIQAKVKQYNMSSDDSGQLYRVYSKVHAGHEDLSKKSTIAMNKENTYALPIIRRQLNSVLKQENGKNFLEFTEVMHTNAVQGYKRSGIPSPSDVEAEKLLSRIKRDLQSIVIDEDNGLVTMAPRLHEVKKNIIAMSAHTKHCPLQSDNVV